MSSKRSFFRRHKIISFFILLPVFLVFLLALFVGYRMIGPDRSYKIDFVKTGDGSAPGVLEVGVAKRDITPDLAQYDEWTDGNNNNKYDMPFDSSPGWLRTVLKTINGRVNFFDLEKAQKSGDSYVDKNGNGKFDAVWIAGFGSNRPAKGVHDPLWARAIAMRNNGVTVVMISIDSIGIFHDKFIDIRKSIDPSLGIDHVMFSSKHIHEVPDTMGIWSGPIPTPWAFDDKYMDLVKKSCKEAAEEAVAKLEPSDMFCVEVDLEPEGFVDDSRKPIVYDRKLCCARFVKHGTDESIATLVSWGNHPETLGGSNPDLTSDFCGYWRDGVEGGVPEPNGVEGLGGMCLYFQGMVGGLMTQLHTTVPDRNGVDTYRDDTWEKAEALGQNLAIVTVNALRGDQVWKNENPRVAVAAKTIYPPMDGLFKYAIALGLIHPGVYWGFKARSEVDVIRIGEVEILTVPGELYPEIADGGIETPEGQDFPIAPVEVPPLRAEVMKGKMNLVVGLANDEIGYIIPKSQWDTEKPYAYGKTNSPQYGEENSGGPEVASVVHRESKALLERMHAALNQ